MAASQSSGQANEASTSLSGDKGQFIIEAVPTRADHFFRHLDFTSTDPEYMTIVKQVSHQSVVFQFGLAPPEVSGSISCVSHQCPARLFEPDELYLKIVQLQGSSKDREQRDGDNEQCWHLLCVEARFHEKGSSKKGLSRDIEPLRRFCLFLPGDLGGQDPRVPPAIRDLTKMWQAVCLATLKRDGDNACYIPAELAIQIPHETPGALYLSAEDATIARRWPTILPFALRTFTLTETLAHLKKKSPKKFGGVFIRETRREDMLPKKAMRKKTAAVGSSKMLDTPHTTLDTNPFQISSIKPAARSKRPAIIGTKRKLPIYSDLASKAKINQSLSDADTSNVEARDTGDILSLLPRSPKRKRRAIKQKTIDLTNTNDHDEETSKSKRKVDIPQHLCRKLKKAKLTIKNS